MSYQVLRPPRREILEVRGLRHRLTWWGERTEQPIVLLHGFQDCGDTWQFMVDRLPPSWSCVAPDWRGFGGTQWAEGGYWFPDYLADLDALLDVLVPNGRARVVGHSMGANIATIYAGVRLQRLSWLANLEGFGLPRATPELAPDRYARWMDQVRQPPRVTRYPSVKHLAANLIRRNPRLTAERAEYVARAWSIALEDEGGRHGGDGNDAAAGSGAVQLRFDPRHRRVNPVLYRIEEAQACWSRIEIPVLILIGAESPFRIHRDDREPNQARMFSLFRDLQIQTVPDVGHMMHLEAPETIAAHLVDFERAHP
ncbi:MAG TPA: alpha/beta hydrolase [Steroidobacteraceae bacterium]|nr:alpha/beta hydrolase [Steroidobacteraceae bacterium]